MFDRETRRADGSGECLARTADEHKRLMTFPLRPGDKPQIVLGIDGSYGLIIRDSCEDVAVVDIYGSLVYRQGPDRLRVVKPDGGLVYSLEVDEVWGAHVKQALDEWERVHGHDKWTQLFACQPNPDYEDVRPAEEVAASLGLIVVYPNDNQLQLDIDSEEQLREFRNRLAAFFGLRDPACDVHIFPSHSGKAGSYHVYINLDREVDEWQRMALQMALGSDPIREMLNVKRKWNGMERPSRLFEKPGFESP